MKEVLALNIVILTRDLLEAQGLKWMLTSQWNDVKVETIVEDWSLLADYRDIHLYIVDLDLRTKKDFNLPTHANWLGLSSERTFQTVYHALQHKAEDVLFRPFQPERLMKHVQQARFHWRNEQSNSKRPVQADESSVKYGDLLLGDKQPTHSVLMSMIVPSQMDSLTHLVSVLKGYAFPTSFDVFAFPDFIVVVHRLQEIELLQEAYRVLFSQWKSQSDALLTIYLYESTDNTSYHILYKKMRRFRERIFYDGYDILTTVNNDLTWSEMDPFLSPVEQQEWIVMLEKQNHIAIREWLEHDFLTLESPFPDPEMVRVRLTSILAQIRRYMTAKSLKTNALEQAYHALFEDTIREPVMYQILQVFISFTAQLLTTSKAISSVGRNLDEKVRELIESNYWDSTWNLTACADQLKLHKSTLSRKFSQEGAMSFRDALLTVRIREAKRLLKETDVSLTEVSRLTGFTYSSYFSAKFKKSTGLSPFEYRQS
jgi:two-component system response regulator YesN